MQRYAAIIFIALLVFSFSCETNEQEVEKIAGPKKAFPTITGKDVDVDYRDSGLVRLRMHTGLLKRFDFNVPEPYYEMDSGLRIFFYDKDGKQVSALSARYGIYYENSRRVEVKYNVVVTNQEGKRLETEKLKWREKDSIRNEGQVIMYQNNRRLIGKKLIAAEDFSHMELEDYVIEIPVDELKKEEGKKE